MSTPMTTPADVDSEILYPSSDGEPVAETPIHLRALFLLLQTLEAFLAKQKAIYVGANMFWYWEEGNPGARCAPDLMVIKGVVRADRRSFFSWKENGAVPSVIVELTSPKTWKEDMRKKRHLYAQLGVREYYLFDPEAIKLKPPLQGFRLNEKGQSELIEADENDRLFCVELNLFLQAEGRMLRLIDGRTGLPILSSDEQKQAALREARAERKRAKAETERAAALEAELSRLRALLKERGINGSS